MLPMINFLEYNDSVTDQFAEDKNFTFENGSFLRYLNPIVFFVAFVLEIGSTFAYGFYK